MDTSGLEMTHEGMPALQQPAGRKRRVRKRRRERRLEKLEQAAAEIPEAARHAVIDGVRRLLAYQDWKYSRLYLERLQPVAEADRHAVSDGKLLSAVAHRLAARMSFDDIIRIAQFKSNPARQQRIAAELGIVQEPPHIAPIRFDIGELCQVLPPDAARSLLSLLKQYPWLRRPHWTIQTQRRSISSSLCFRLLARLRRLRPQTYRYAQEQSAIKYWLQHVLDAARFSPALACEIAECAQLIRGYGDTHKRGAANFLMISEKVIRPALHQQLPIQQAIEILVRARNAALADPDGESLAICLNAPQPGGRIAAG